MKKNLLKALVAVLVFFAAVGAASIVGGLKKYDAAEVEAELTLRTGDYPEIEQARQARDAKTEEIETLQAEIAELQGKCDELSAFEANRADSEAELAELNSQVETLSAQKVSLEQSIAALDAELADY